MPFPTGFGRPKGLFAMSTKRWSVAAGAVVTAALVGVTALATDVSNASTLTLDPHSYEVVATSTTSSELKSDESVASVEPTLAESSATLVTTVQPASATPVFAVANTSVTVQSGDWLIKIITRVCGSAPNWQSVAADNGIKGPNYVIYPGQIIKVNCGSSTKPVVATSTNPPVATQTSNGWAHPLPGRCAGSGYGNRVHPTSGSVRMHWGVDIGAPSGTPIRAAHAGIARHGYQSGGAGIYVTVSNGPNGVATTYFHMSSRAVGNGVHVNAGDVIGYVGSTGNSTGPHLHFEVHTGGLWSGKVNPATFMADRGIRLYC